MKKARFIAILGVLAALGFVLGWVTGTTDMASLQGIHRQFPMLPAPPKPDPAQLAVPPKPEEDVILETPEEGTRPPLTDTTPPTASFVVSGRAKAGGVAMRVSVTDSTGTSLFNQSVPVTLNAGDPYGRFTVTVDLTTVPSAPVTLHVGRDADGAVTIDRLVLFGQTDSVTLQTFFVNTQKGGTDACDLVYPVQRNISGNNIVVYRAVIEALLAGPNADEVASGFRTAIPIGVKLKSVAADADGVVTADFDRHLTTGVSDTCKKQSIRAEIGATLKQFPEVHDVVITVDGKADNVLQP